MKDRVVNFLEISNLTNTSEYGFRHGRSRVIILLDFYHYMHSECDHSRAVDVVFLDLSNASNKVPHKRLMKMVCPLGIQGNVGAWIENWLAGRRQRALVNGVLSNWTAVSSGVPQGPVSRLLLFVIYIYNLDLCLSKKVSKVCWRYQAGV